MTFCCQRLHLLIGRSNLVTLLKLSMSTKQLKPFVVTAPILKQKNEYNPSFVREVNKAKREEATQEYAGKGSLLKLLRNENRLQ